MYGSHRPNGRSLTVWQGKGTSPTHSKVSALMEGVETFHAEDIPLPIGTETLATMAPYLHYKVDGLDLLVPNVPHRGTVLEWIPARPILGHSKLRARASCWRTTRAVRKNQWCDVPAVWSRDPSGQQLLPPLRSPAAHRRGARSDHGAPRRVGALCRPAGVHRPRRHS